MNLSVYYFLHVVSAILLAGGVFYAVAAPAETRKRTLILTGIAALVMLFGGFGLLARVHGNHFYAWVIVKIACWAGLSALAGLAYRRREKAGLWAAIGIVCVVLGVAMAYFKPGM